MDTLYTFGDSITHSKTESVNFLGLTNSATKFKDGFFRCGGLGFRGRTGKPYKVGNRIKVE